MHWGGDEHHALAVRGECFAFCFPGADGDDDDVAAVLSQSTKLRIGEFPTFKAT